MPISSVRQVQVLDRVIGAVRGLRVPGTGWPGKIAVGTFVRRGHGRTFAVVHHDTPRGIRITLEGARYRDLVVGCADPEAARAGLALP